jgi:parvulin-like peptidyl-prolyl isomerase
VAWVNDVPIERRALSRLLWESRGLALLQQLVLRDVARQEAERLELSITPEDVDREYDLTLQADRFDGDDPENLTPTRREQLIDEWTRTRGVTRRELAIAMERQAYLRQMVKDRITITEAMLRREFARTHGEKVEVRHIQLDAPRTWPQIEQRIKMGEDFADLVADYSRNRLSRQDRGLLPPFTAEDPGVPAAFAKVAFALEPGQISNPIEVEGSYHVLRLERRIPAEEVTFDQVEQELRKNLRARLLAEEMERLGQKLISGCKLRIEDRLLRQQYQAQHAAGRLAGPPLVGQ